MIARSIYDQVAYRLARFDSVALLGPRQVGKTTLALEIAAASAGNAKYLDLENPRDRVLLDDAASYFDQHKDTLIILDEIQRAPEIFTILRGAIDARRRMKREGGKFLLLGSASMDLLRQSSESLAGRISYVEMAPISLTEALLAGEGDRLAILNQLWLRGGFPLSYFADRDDDSLLWREDFLQSYIERDMPQFGIQVDSEQMDRFWRMLAVDQGELLNAQRYARSLGVSGPTVMRYLSILEKLLMQRQLTPWHANIGKRLVKSPRPFVRDSGILHALLGIRTLEDLLRHPVAGKSWEGFVIENLVTAAAGRARPLFFRTSAGAEADLLLEFAPGEVWAFEVKLSASPRLDKGFPISADDVGAKRRILVHKGEDSFPMRGGVEAMPLASAMHAVAEAAGR